ncbi:zinc finger protein 629-like isoform X1 [Syngnathus acus]|uniref:zinc finger protein 629-like isoform X1 n=1 Tax=Syngnathus acus TaxID=161584 RepID=UPI001885D7E7|nr:zinc finger protein 629-like isoform X1 [Syngnathus acus]
MLQALVRQRLIAAADEIFELFEKTIATYEAQLCRAREETERQRRQLEAISKTQPVSHIQDVQLLISHQGQELSPRLQGDTSSLEHPQPLHVREQEADVPMKSEEEPTESQRMMTETKGDHLFAPLSDGDDIGELLRSGTDSAEEYAGSSRLEHPQPSHVKEEEEDSSSSNLLLSSPLVKCEDDDNSPDWLPLDHGAPTACVQSHASTRTRKKLLSCSVCGHRFFRKIHLAAHMRKHGGDNAASCCVCGQRFSSNVALIAHAVTHTVDGPLVCPICAKRFSCKTKLSDHIHSHRQDSLRCSFCDKPFTQKVTLERHMKAHALEKTFTCSICDKTFPQEGTMVTHMRIHTTGKDFPCPLCGRRFCVEANMVSHMKTHKA